ncbi:hypothetical protein MASR2M47_13080 [Draconibacterium sp.]|jgi:hypothetical protein
MEFKKLEIEPEGSWLKRTITSAHFRKSIIYIVIGAIAGFAFTYFSAGKPLVELSNGEIFQSMIFGGFIGFFITNSPCARNKC